MPLNGHLSWLGSIAQNQSPSIEFKEGDYFAYLENVIASGEGTFPCDITFELTPYQELTAQLGLQPPNRNPDIVYDAPPRDQNASFDGDLKDYTWLYTLEGVEQENWNSWNMFHRGQESDLIGGAWFVVTMVNKTIPLETSLHHVESFVIDSNTPSIENFHIKNKSLRLLLVPEIITRELTYRNAIPDHEPSYPITNNLMVKLLRSTYRRPRPSDTDTVPTTMPAQKKHRSQSGITPDTLNNNVISIGIMDVGIANCVMLINENKKPYAYLDVGFPLPKYIKSLPANMLPENVKSLPNGPITDKNMQIFITHWDHDHWFMGKKYPDLQKLKWNYKDTKQLIGVQARTFINDLEKIGKITKVTSKLNIKNLSLVESTPGNSTSKNAYTKNNNGLAMLLKKLPVGKDDYANVLLPGDASFHNIKIPNIDLGGIMAAHHGSSNHRAAEVGITPVFQDNQGVKQQQPPNGLIAYSYGMYAIDPSPSGKGLIWKRPYNFPRKEAISQYEKLNWTNAQSTAEGEKINSTPDPKSLTDAGNRGNICMGNQKIQIISNPMTAFSTFQHQLSLNPVTHKPLEVEHE